MRKIISTLLFCLSSTLYSTNNQTSNTPEAIDYVTIAILAKDKAHLLDLYLECIEKQTWPASKTYLYIRTNNNNDTTASLLLAWINKVGEKYAGIYFDNSDVSVPVQKYRQHEWNHERFNVLSKIQDDSIAWAYQHKSHYFVADCDNFIKPHTLESLMKTQLPIVAPLLHAQNSCYSNYHQVVDKNGYYVDSTLYYDLLEQRIRGLIQVPVVSCTYLVRYEVLSKIYYNDQSKRCPYVIFSDSARKNSIPQYIDTRDLYGGMSVAETTLTPEQHAWITVYALGQDWDVYN